MTVTDADVSMSSEDDYLQYFDLTPAHFPWRAPRPREIEERRARMSDLLIFDILLSSGGIRQPHTLYPPMDAESLERLLEAISHCAFDGLKKDCLVYFLLKWHQDGREEEFKHKRSIPPQFAALSDAYWHLDSGINIARAVSGLSDARLSRDHTPKVMQALSLSENAHYLIRTFVRTAKPLITEPDDIDAYTIALAESTLMEAWLYQRSFPETSETRKRLIYKILDWCLMPKPRAVPLTNLLALPLSSYEQALVHGYACEPPSRLPISSVPVIRDLVCIRLVQNGQHAAAIKLDRQFASMTHGTDKTQRATIERRQMMDELMAAMPAAERQLLELELEEFAQGRSMDLSISLGSGAKGKGKATDMNMSMSISWEQIQSTSTNGNISASIAPSTQAIPQRSGAPRFGGPVPAPATNGDVFASSSVSRVTPSAAPQMPQPPSQGPLVFGGFSAQPFGSSSVSAVSSLKPKSTPNGTAPTLFAGIGAPRQSLFDTAGSANAAPNAFYQPPASTSAKRPLLFGSMVSRAAPTTPPVSAFASLSGQPATSASGKAARSGRPSGGDADPADTAFNGLHDADISMLSELSESDSGRADESASVVRALDNSADMDMSAEFSVSVFGASGSTRKIATTSGARLARTETEARLPPGAFLPDDDVNKGTSQSISASKSTNGQAKRTRASTASRKAARDPSPVPEPKSEPTPAPAPTREPVRTRTSARRKVKDQDLSRSIPGALIDDDDDTEEEVPQPQQQQAEEEEDEGDDIAPLPTPARRTRKSRASSNVPQPETPRATRRSSRLSTVSSVGSSSPEPLSPQKPSARARKSTRTSAPSAAGASSKGAASSGVKTRKRRAA